MGLLGLVTMAVAGNNALQWTVKYEKNNSGTLVALNGASYYSSAAYFSVPINGITLLSEVGPSYTTFSNGDTVKFYVYAKYIGSSGSGPTVELPPSGPQMVISPVVI
jgi:hypothetical protein